MTRREANVLGKEDSAEAAERAAPTPAAGHRHRKRQMISCHAETQRVVIYSPDLEESASVLTGRQREMGSEGLDAVTSEGGR